VSTSEDCTVYTSVPMLFAVIRYLLRTFTWHVQKCIIMAACNSSTKEQWQFLRLENTLVLITWFQVKCGVTFQYSYISRVSKLWPAMSYSRWLWSRICSVICLSFWNYSTYRSFLFMFDKNLEPGPLPEMKMWIWY
jgi:hypothetical protein